MVEEIILRAPEPKDINLIYIWENSSDESHSSLRTGPISRHQISQYIEAYDGEIYTLGSLRFMIDAGGTTVGTIDIFDFDRRARHAFVGVYIQPLSRRKGVAKNALSKVEAYVRQKIGMYALAALVAEDNKASRRLFESAGYKNSGKLQGWLTDGAKRINAILYEHVL